MSRHARYHTFAIIHFYCYSLCLLLLMLLEAKQAKKELNTWCFCFIPFSLFVAAAAARLISQNYLIKMHTQLFFSLSLSLSFFSRQKTFSLPTLRSVIGAVQYHCYGGFNSCLRVITTSPTRSLQVKIFFFTLFFSLLFHSFAKYNVKKSKKSGLFSINGFWNAHF